MSSKFVLQQEDGTIANGNARGAYSVDLQMSRTAADQVAGSGEFAVIAGGSNNRNVGPYGFIGGGAGNSIGVGGAGSSYGYNILVGGLNNQIINLSRRSVISGGWENTINSAENSVIAGGRSNTAFNFIEYATISGGQSNSASSSYSTISGGQSNTASTGTHATVVGGQSNTASGQYSVAGGIASVASGKGSVAIGTNDPGAGNVASGIGAVALGGRTNASGNYSFTGGRENLTNSGVASILYGDSNSNTASYNATFGRFNSNSKLYNLAFGQGTIAAYDGALSFQSRTASTSSSDFGIAQSHQLTMQKTANLNSAGTTPLYIDGNVLSLIPRANNIAWNVTVKWVAVCTATGSGTTAVGDVAIATDSFMFKRVSGTSSIGTVQNLQNSQDATMAGATCSYAVGGSQDLQIIFTAPASANATTFRVVAKVELTECAW